ncbi:hypothetical protein [Tautonia marina]|uniref:hypothetical protein n=1 Tax=Tautonia marina TaxID=2653855 RepID=UPI0012611659|nr:hypothetical protein [Tautonia marina]
MTAGRQQTIAVGRAFPYDGSITFDRGVRTRWAAHEASSRRFTMIRPALLWFVLIASAGCADRPDQTPPAQPVESDEVVSDSASVGDPLPTLRESTRIETH